MKISALILAVLLPAASLATGAQDVPARAGRIAYIEGQAAVYQDPEIGWDKAWVNTPLTSQNSLWTEPRSRAEVRVSGVAIRLDQLTQLDVARLEDDGIDAFVPRGTVAVRIRHAGGGARFSLAFPQGQLQLLADGQYRLEVDPDRDEAVFAVFSGAAALRSASGDVAINAGNAVRLTGGARPSFNYERIAARDFDRWVASRDEGWSERATMGYVSPYMTGYEDLDAWGQWSQDPEMGPVWFPTRVDAGWAPYRYGHWAYVRPWGYTWVDDAPWGYAPFHYGRWVYLRNRWAWCPGERVARPVWAPALVAWVGGGGVSIGVNVGSALGWYPLSPWDRYDPWFRAPATYVSQVNVIVNHYDRRGGGDRRREWHDNTRQRGATVVNRDEFRVNRPVPQAVVPVGSDAFRRLPQANPAQLLPSREEIVQRRAQVQPGQPAAPQPSTVPGRASMGGSPTFARPQASPAPAMVPGSVPAQAAPPQAAPAPQANTRQNREAQDRARRAQDEVAARQRLLEGQTPAQGTGDSRQEGLDIARQRAQEQQRAQQEQQRAQQEQQRSQQQRAQQERLRQQQEALRVQQEQQRAQQQRAQQEPQKAPQDAQRAQQRAQQELQRQPPQPQAQPRGQPQQAQPQQAQPQPAQPAPKDKEAQQKGRGGQPQPAEDKDSGGRQR